MVSIDDDDGWFGLSNISIQSSIAKSFGFKHEFTNSKKREWLLSEDGGIKPSPINDVETFPVTNWLYTNWKKNKSTEKVTCNKLK